MKRVIMALGLLTSTLTANAQNFGKGEFTVTCTLQSAFIKSLPQSAAADFNTRHQPRRWMWDRTEIKMKGQELHDLGMSVGYADYWHTYEFAKLGIPVCMNVPNLSTSYVSCDGQTSNRFTIDLVGDVAENAPGLSPSSPVTRYMNLHVRLFKGTNVVAVGKVDAGTGVKVVRPDIESKYLSGQLGLAAGKRTQRELVGGKMNGPDRAGSLEGVKIADEDVVSVDVDCQIDPTH